MGNESQQLIEQDLQESRENLSRDVDALADKVSPSRVVGRRVDGAKNRLSGAKDKLMGSAQGAGSSLGDATSSAGDSVSGAVDGLGSSTDLIHRTAWAFLRVAEHLS